MCKKRNIKNIIAGSSIAALIVAAMCFSGCGSDPAYEEQKDTPSKESITSEIISTPTPAPTVIIPDEEKAEDEEAVSEEPANEENISAEHDEYDSSLADKHVRIRLNGNGKDVFALWGSGKPDYRYGPSLMLCDDGGVDAWFASPGDGKKEYDWITYRHSDDGGETWGDEKVVLSPTPNTADFKSVCDPDVFYHDGYYYMGYTATINKEGLCNNVFLARSHNPDGPFEKWDGNGWEGDPVPIVYFTGVDIGWGVGEPSFVAVDDKLYLYNTLDSFSEKYGWVRATEVRTADLTDPLWPAKLQYEAISVYRNDCTDSDDYTYADSDSWDVAYLEDSRKFVALTTNRRFKDDSCLLYYESDDGINFERVSELNSDVYSGCHNCGLMADAEGHIRKGDKKLIGYAYAGTGESKWGVWATRFVPIEIDYTEEVDREEDDAENYKEKIKIDESLLGKDPIMLLTDQLTYTTSVGAGPIDISYYLFSSYRSKSRIGSEEVKIEKYDRNILELTDGRLSAIKEGITTVRIEYKGLRRDICVRVLPDDYDESQIRRFYPVCKRIDISVNEPIILKVRPMAVLGNYDIDELSGYEINVNDIKFRSSDTKVCRIDKDGTLTPVSAGTTVISIEGDGCRCTIDVYVTE